MTAVRRITRIGFEYIEDGFDKVFSPAWNPFYQLGALGWFFYWIVIASGIYLYVFFDTGITQAYASVEYITHEQWYAAGVMRSLHRYASDALVVVMMLHLVREYVTDRYRGKRWFAWVTGVPMLWFVYAAGISGYWLVWDKLAQYIAIATSEWLDTLPFFGEPIARNFLNETTLSGRFFTLMVFIHIAVPLILLFIMWLHINRHAQAKINPPRGLAAGTLAMLLVLSFVYPALSQGGAANLDVVPAVVNPDWFYLPAYPVLDFVPGEYVWAILVLTSFLLVWLPWLPAKKTEAVAAIDLDNCNGCRRCYEDCPFSAITMLPRTDGKPYKAEAVVNASHCTSCGICVGACPTATPYRRATELLPGVDLPDRPLRELRAQILEATAALSGEARVVVFGCECGTDLHQLRGPGVAVLALPCIAAIPPSFFDFIIFRKHADGVFLAGCREGDCHFRLGLQWMEQRLDRKRDPYLRQRVPRERIASSWSGLAGGRRAQRDLQQFRAQLKVLDSENPTEPSAQKGESEEEGDAR